MRREASVATSHRMAQAVLRRGQARLDTLAEDFPDLTREQMQKALDNAHRAGLVRLVQPGKSGRWGGRQGVWEGLAIPDPRQPRTTRRPPRVIKEPAIHTRPPCSVFHLSERPPVTVWPPAYENARQYAPLGPWSEEANDTNRRSAA